LKEQNWQTLEKALQEKIGKGMVGKGGDVRMVISSLEYLSKCPGLNIVRHIYQKIKTTEDEDRVEDLYHELQGIKQVGPKISSFFLRDVLNLFHNELEPLLPPRAYLYLQPFDTWVKQLSQDAGIVDKEDSPERAIRKIVVSCREAGVSPVLFNQGLWKIGSQKISLNPLLNQA
jgi:hypothetical protein